MQGIAGICHKIKILRAFVKTSCELYPYFKDLKAISLQIKIFVRTQCHTLIHTK